MPLQPMESDDVVRRLDGHHIDKGWVIRARWVLTWKKEGTNKKAKARLALLGYMDPDLGSDRQDAPTTPRASKYLLAATARRLGEAQ